MRIEDFVEKNELKEIKFARHKKDQFTYVLQFAPQVRSILVGGTHRQVKVPLHNERVRRRGRLNVFTQAFASMLHVQRYETRWVREEDASFRLAFPYLIFIVNFKGRRYDKTAVAVRNEPLESVDDKIYRLPLSNVYRFPDGLGLCMDFHGTGGAGEMKSEWGIIKKLRSVVDGFWFTRFGGTRAYVAQPGLDPRVNDYLEWEENTKNDPSFITTVQWSDPDWTIRELIDKINDDGEFGIRRYWEEDDAEEKKEKQEEFSFMHEVAKRKKRIRRRRRRPLRGRNWWRK